MRPFQRTFVVAVSASVLAFAPCASSAQEQPRVSRKIIRQVAASYPELASKMRMTGTVRLEAVVGTNGKVKTTQVLGGSPLLVQAAVDAVEKWQWSPAPQETKELVQLDFHPGQQ
jgi:TonB family protein